MKLPWDKQYLKISFHVIFTLAVGYILMNIIDVATFILIDLRRILGDIFSGIGTFLRIISPLTIAFVIAYLFDPLVDFYQDRYEIFKKNILIPFFEKHDITKPNFIKARKSRKDDYGPFKQRLAGASLTYLTAFTAIYIIVWMLVRNLGFGREGGLLAMINYTIDTLSTLLYNLEALLADWGYLDSVLDFIDEAIQSLNSYILYFINSAVTIAASAGAWLLNFFISLVVAFFFMNNKEKLKHQIKAMANIFLPKKINNILTLTLEDFHAVFSGYVRGLILDGIILGTLIAITLSIIGVELAILIGVLTAIFNLIPFFGGIVAFFLSVLFELLMGSPLNALLAGIAIIIIQQIDTIFIVPKVVGERVKLSAPVVMLSLTIAGSIFGILGMLLIVPSIAIAKIFFMRFTQRYVESKWKRAK